MTYDVVSTAMSARLDNQAMAYSEKKEKKQGTCTAIVNSGSTRLGCLLVSLSFQQLHFFCKFKRKRNRLEKLF